MYESKIQTEGHSGYELKIGKRSESAYRITVFTEDQNLINALQHECVLSYVPHSIQYREDIKKRKLNVTANVSLTAVQFMEERIQNLNLSIQKADDSILIKDKITEFSLNLIRQCYA